MLVRFEGHRHALKFFLQIVALPFFQILHHTLCQPFEKFLVVSRQGVQHPVHTFGDKRLTVKLDLIGRELPDLSGEGLEGLLKEAVDGADCERAVVVEDVAQHGLRPAPKRVLRLESRDKILIIRRILRLPRKQVQLLQNPAFHLVRGLVGECHGKDVPVRVSLFIRQQKPYVCLGQVEGLSRPGRRFHYPDHFPVLTVFIIIPILPFFPIFQTILIFRKSF